MTDKYTTITIQATETMDAYNLSSILSIGGISATQTSPTKVGGVDVATLPNPYYTNSWYEYTTDTDGVTDGVKVHFTKQEDLFTVNDVIRLMWSMTH